MSLSFGVAITSLIISLIVIVKYGDKFGNFSHEKAYGGFKYTHSGNFITFISLLCLGL